jgi:hypothetical protein
VHIFYPKSFKNIAGNKQTQSAGLIFRFHYNTWAHVGLKAAQVPSQLPGLKRQANENRKH